MPDKIWTCNTPVNRHLVGRTHDPTERLLTILRHLKEAKESGAIDAGTSVAIQQTMDGVYRGQSGQRKWRDIQSLRDRGLIETDLPPNRTGIRLTGARKPERLHLTAEEHAAINHARRLLHPVSQWPPRWAGRAAVARTMSMT